MVRMPTNMPKSGNTKKAQQVASDTVDELKAEAEQMRHPGNLGDRGRRTLEDLQEDARKLGDYARGKMGEINEAMHDAADSARKSTGLPSSTPAPADAMSDSVMDSLKTANEKLSAEINELGERVESVKVRVAQSIQQAGGKAADTWQQGSDAAKDTWKQGSDAAKNTWQQSSEAAKNVGEREYCLPLPTDRICARHVVWFGLPVFALLMLMMLRRRYPKKWDAGVNKMKQPRKMMARDMPSKEKMQRQVEGNADKLEQTVESGKQRASGMVGDVHDKYENKKDQ